MMELINGLSQKNATEVKVGNIWFIREKQEMWYSDFSVHYHGDWWVRNMKSSSSAVGEQVFLWWCRELPALAARSCSCTIAVSCLCGCAMNQKEQIKMKIFFLLLLIFHRPEWWHWEAACGSLNSNCCCALDCASDRDHVWVLSWWWLLL